MKTLLAAALFAAATAFTVTIVREDHPGDLVTLVPGRDSNTWLLYVPPTSVTAVTIQDAPNVDVTEVDSTVTAVTLKPPDGGISDPYDVE